MQVGIASGNITTIMATLAEPKPPAVPPAEGEAATPWYQAAVPDIVIGALLVFAFWPIVLSMYGSWFDEHAYMEHGVLVLPAAAYMIWAKKDQLKTIPRQPSTWGLLLLVWGALQAVLALAAQWVWAGRMAFLISLTGAVALRFGWRMLRELVYPLCTLLLMITPPTFLFTRLTFSLQLLASRLGEACLEALGYSVLREGNVLELVGIRLSVEEACSGIRSLMAILFMCVLYNYFFVRGWKMKTMILVMAIPIAILGNAVRIVATGIASQYNPALVKGEAHEAFGYVSVLAAAVGCVLFHLSMTYLLKIWRRNHG